MPTSKSKRRKVLQAERDAAQKKQRSNQGFNRLSAEKHSEAREEGFVPMKLAEVPAAARPQIEAMLAKMGSRGRLYRKPDGGIAVIA
jgi:hypothetical protein